MPFDYLTLAGARANVLARLQDSNGVFWISDEIDGAIREALQVWNVATLYYRERATFNTTPGQSFYDISSVLSNGTELVLQRTLTTQQIVKQIIYALMENQGQTVDGSTWVGTEMFTLDDLTQAVYRRVNQFLEDTGQIVTKQSIAVVPGDGRIDLDLEWIDVRRAGWTTPEGEHSVLWRTSEFILDSQFENWETSPQTPQSYSIATAPLIWLQLAPPPSDIGTLDLLTVNAVTSDAVVNIFNDFGWAIKYGAMADLMGQQGEAYDPERAAYCQQRYAEGVQLSNIMSTVLRIMINGQVVQPCSLFDLDTGVPGWEDAVGDATNDLATPQTPAIAAPNLLALYPVPNVTLSIPDGRHSITADVVRNAILPINDSDFIQLDRSFLDTIIGYAVHILSLKIGGAEFQSTFALYQAAFAQAQEQNQRLKAIAPDLPVLAEQEEAERPRLKAA